MNHFDHFYILFIHQFTLSKGRRVIALASKPLPPRTSDQLKAMPRHNAESDLTFLGFLVFGCPIKEEAPQLIDDLRASSHRLVMITGDSPLTACQVARDLKMVEKPLLFLHPLSSPSSPSSSSLITRDIHGRDVDTVTPSSLSNLAREYSFCMDGNCVSALTSSAHGVSDSIKLLAPYVKHVSVFARATPEHKEAIVLAINHCGETSFMCGDGTNDVGALRQAHVGVAILSDSSSRASGRGVLEGEEEVGGGGRRGKSDGKGKKEKKESRLMRQLEEMVGGGISLFS